MAGAKYDSLLGRLTEKGSGSAGSISSGSVLVDVIGSPAVDTLQDNLNTFQSAGLISGGDFTDNLDGTATIAAGEAYARTSDSIDAPIVVFTFPETIINTFVESDTQANLVIVDYNGGTPQVVNFVGSPSTILGAEYDRFELYSVVKEGTTLHTIAHYHKAKDTTNLVQKRLHDEFHISVTSGVRLTETGTGNITVSAGTAWVKLNKLDFAGVNTSTGDTMDSYYYNGAGYTKATGLTQWDNLRYNNGGVLTAMGVAKYSNLWFYADPDGELFWLYDVAQYDTQGNAIDADEPANIPGRAAFHGKLIAQLTFQQNAATATNIKRFTNGEALTSAIVNDHQNLINLELADNGVTYGHISDQAQTLYGDKTINDNLTVQGDLTVNGSTVTANVTNIESTGDIKTSGALGVNTSTIDGEVTVGDAADTLQRINLNGDNTGIYRVRYGSSDAGDGNKAWYVGRNSDSTFRAVYATGTSSDNGIIVAKDGSVGIGTSSPASGLHINSGSTGDQLSLQRSGISSRRWIMELPDSTSDFHISDSTSGLSRLYIKNNGNVGIGTNSPARKFVVSSGDTSAAFIQLVNTTSGETLSDGGYISHSGTLMSIGNQETADMRLFVDNSGDRGIRIQSTTGNVGIGVPSPTAKLHIGGTAGVDGLRYPDGTLQTTAAMPVIWGYQASQYTSGQTAYSSFGGLPTSGAIEDESLTPMPRDGTIKNLRLHVGTNTLNVPAVVTIRKNKVDTAIELTVPAGTSGEFSDLSNSISVLAGDKLSVRYVTSAGTGNAKGLNFSAEYIYD